MSAESLPQPSSFHNQDVQTNSDLLLPDNGEVAPYGRAATVLLVVVNLLIIFYGRW